MRRAVQESLYGGALGRDSSDCLLPAVVHLRSIIEPLADFEDNWRHPGLEEMCTGDAFLRPHWLC